MNLIQQVLKKVEQSETPTAFYYWAVLIAISSIVKRNVFLRKAYDSYVFPNMYVFIIADSGLRKGAAVTLARNLVSKLMVTKTIYGRGSIEAIINELSKQVTFPNGNVINTASGLIAFDELAAGLLENRQAQAILTTLYDSNYFGEWENTLKGSGKEVLKGLYVTMFAATNPTLLDVFLEESSFTGGFIARIMMVYESQKSHINDGLDFDENTPMVPAWEDPEIMNRFKEISLLKGQFSFSPEAKKLYKDWYYPYNEQMERGEIKDDTGTSSRVHDQILKVAMLLSLAEDNDLIIKEHQMTEAMNNCLGRSVEIAKSLGQLRGKGELSEQFNIFIDELLKAEKFTMTREEMLKRNFRHFDAGVVDRLADTMFQSGTLEIRRGERNTIIYSLSSKFASELSRGLRRF